MNQNDNHRKNKCTTSKIKCKILQKHAQMDKNVEPFHAKEHDSFVGWILKTYNGWFCPEI